jgi:hypothetical protein
LICSLQTNWLTTGDLEWTALSLSDSGTGCPAPWGNGADYGEGATVSDAKGVVWTCKTGQAAHCSIHPPTLGTLGGYAYWTATASCTGTVQPTIAPTFYEAGQAVGCPEVYASGTT